MPRVRQMAGHMMEEVAIDIPGSDPVPGLLNKPAAAKACLVLAHGAGAGMRHTFLQAVAEGMHARDVATLRFEFPYMAKGSRRPDPPKVAAACVRAAVVTAAELAPGLPLFAGGKSFGGRMTSTAQAAAALPEVRGLVFLGFPLHAAKTPSVVRAAHLAAVAVPMLFLQGSRDALAEPALIEAEVAKVGARATLVMTDDADHSFHVPKRSGRTDAEVMESLLDAIAAWMDAVLLRA